MGRIFNDPSYFIQSGLKTGIIGSTKLLPGRSKGSLRQEDQDAFSLSLSKDRGNDA